MALQSRLLAAIKIFPGLSATVQGARLSRGKTLEADS